MEDSEYTTNLRDKHKENHILLAQNQQNLPGLDLSNVIIKG
jgi:hypothetical protein